MASPNELVLDQAGVFVGADDRPAPLKRYLYRRDEDVDGTQVYRHVAAA